MRIDMPICIYGESECRKRFDGNCTVKNDFDTRCPVCKTLNEVLKIIDIVGEYKTYSGMGELEIWIDKDELIEEIKALKGGNDRGCKDG